MINDDDKIAERLGHEPLGVSARSITISIAVLMGVVVASLLVMGGLMFGLSRIWDGSATVNAPPGPKEPEDLRAAFRALRNTENKLLTEYGWVDEQAGLARIPIARAMEIEAARLGTPATDESTRETQ
jgi:hypothetical protein